MPAHSAGNVLKKSFRSLSEALFQVDYPPMCVVHTAYPRSNVRNKTEGFGALNPKKENKFTAGSIWTSSIFPERSGKEEFLFTTFVGGTLYKENAFLEEKEIRLRVHQELSDIYAIHGNPLFQQVVKWEKSIPQYNHKIVPLKKEVAKVENQGLYICSNILGGVSMPDCIRKGREMASKLSASI